MHVGKRSQNSFFRPSAVYTLLLAKKLFARANSVTGVYVSVLMGICPRGNNKVILVNIPFVHN
jgi:hypothetical protein